MSRPAPKSTSLFSHTDKALFIVFVVVCLITCGPCYSPNDSKKDDTPKDPRTEKIQKQFSGFHGYHRDLVSIVKSNMKDPKSFDHVETKFGDKGDHLLIYMRYRGTNSFGAVVTEEIGAKYTIDGALIELIQE